MSRKHFLRTTPLATLAAAAVVLMTGSPASAQEPADTGAATAVLAEPLSSGETPPYDPAIAQSGVAGPVDDAVLFEAGVDGARSDDVERDGEAVPLSGEGVDGEVTVTGGVDTDAPLEAQSGAAEATNPSGSGVVVGVGAGVVALAALGGYLALRRRSAPTSSVGA